MARSTISIVLRCAVLLVVSVEVRGGVAVAHTGPPCDGESLACCQVQRSLSRLADIEDSLNFVMDKLATIEARLNERNMCSSNQCQNGGTCVDENTSFRCACVTGYTGVLCELNVDECSSGPCQNGARCYGGVNGYTCICAAGYTGTVCHLDVDECSSNPCQNGATCSDGVFGYTCTCVAGYADTTCSSDVDECLSDPCQNGATCYDGVNGYTCVCAAGYIGTACNFDVDECSSNPCQNGARCSDGANGYTCTCVAGFAGAHCRLDVDECASNPCPTDATCSNEMGGYTCLCDLSTVTHRDCEEVRIAMCSVSGVYTVTPSGGTPIQVYCDMATDSGGWLVFQKRQDGLVDFYRDWQSYAAGFGDLNGEFWLGNRNLHLLTQQKTYTLRVVLGDWEANQRYAQYSSFTIGSEQDKFRLGLRFHSGSTGDSLISNSGNRFSALDQDYDNVGGYHCAQMRRGAWWYKRCGDSNLNGLYYTGGPYTRAQTQTGRAEGVRWDRWKGEWYSLKTTRMMIRPAR